MPERAAGGPYGAARRRQASVGGGQAPRPGTAAGRAAIRCAFCGSDRTELFSLFGSSLLTSQYYCRACRSTFEHVKWGDEPET